jgi:hypothetical protein
MDFIISGQAGYLVLSGGEKFLGACADFTAELSTSVVTDES